MSEKRGPPRHNLLAQHPALADDRTEVQLLLEDPARPADASAEDPAPPTTFTSIPDRLASEKPPLRPDYLADNNAEAANRTAGPSGTAWAVLVLVGVGLHLIAVALVGRLDIR